ncbi:COP23 domain-containing protein [Anabaena sp. UHCC 0451]|uniref:COP23 domain-containing protein n=1 Tax=Anabaena sp. UHCC 0451 TaxID=2055235 RepID=UPI002B20EE90|nr:COP23 domain-containing protein [Anabaena sp. UHCC 0451]MEA5575595.1 COP23 domain-containing protein [Anabaena sp. UHCC 0451]
MNPRLSITFIFGALLALATTLSISEPSYARGTTFYCGRSGGQYFTFARTEDGRIYRVMGWTSTDFPTPYNPKNRCYEVSSRFQRNYDNGTLRKIASGIVNRQPVICSGSDANTICNSRNLLFTLKTGANRKAVANRLFNRNALAAGKILTQNGDPDDIMFDFDIYFQQLTSE